MTYFLFCIVLHGGMLCGRLTVESPVGYRRHSDAALEHGAVRQKQEGGQKSSIGLEENNNNTEL